MGLNLTPNLIIDLFFKPFQGADMQVHDFAAGETDKMVVMLAVQAEIVIELPVRVYDLADDPSHCQFIEISVNSREAYPCKAFPQILVDFFRAYVTTGTREEIKDSQALGGDLELKLFQHHRVIMVHGGGFFLSEW
jgi:hypothetical protein